MGSGIPKQFLRINDKPILVHTVKLFQQHDLIDKIYISTLEDYIEYVEDLVEEFRLTKVAGVIKGGETAQDSIYNCLKKGMEENDGDSIVLLHDGVRPCVSYDTITRNIEGTIENGNAITSLPCFETILVSDSGKTVSQVPLRKDTYSAQAPQTFYLKDILEAHDRIRATENGYLNMVDACTICHTLGIKVNLVEGNRGNIKVTTPEDVYMMRAIMQYEENEQAFGFGLTGMNRINYKRSRAK